MRSAVQSFRSRCRTVPWTEESCKVWRSTECARQYRVPEAGAGQYLRQRRAERTRRRFRGPQRRHPRVPAGPSPSASPCLPTAPARPPKPAIYIFIHIIRGSRSGSTKWSRRWRCTQPPGGKQDAPAAGTQLCQEAVYWQYWQYTVTLAKQCTRVLGQATCR